MPTIKELLLQIPEHGEAAVRNCLNEDHEGDKGIDRLQKQGETISKALVDAFSWNQSPEKGEFWIIVWMKNGGVLTDFD